MELTASELSVLEALDFDGGQFDVLRKQLREGSFPANTVNGPISAPLAGVITELPYGAEAEASTARGRALIEQGEAALVLLNGGMATRFGGLVKGVVEALPGRSFLALQMGRMAKMGSCPLLIMNSQATDSATQEHLKENSYFGMRASDVYTFTQSAAPRLRPDASLYRDAAGALSLYGPGHGDLLPSLRRSGALSWLKKRGVRYLLVANVDNLAADLSPDLLGLFASGSSQMMAEVCRKESDDVGGCPATVDGRTQIIEGFAFPKDFDQSSLPAFNTNTLWFQCEALERELPLRWYLVRKQVDGEDVVQFERLVGQASWFLDSTFALVPRSRFCPVKSREDLEAVQNVLRALFPEEEPAAPSKEAIGSPENST